MSQIAVVYWSGTGHTQAMAEAVAKACGAQLFTAEEFSAGQVAEEDAIAVGWPAGGAGGRGLGGGDGEWMRNWEEDCISAGATLACDSVICQDDPDDSALAECEALGKALQ